MTELSTAPTVASPGSGPGLHVVPDSPASLESDPAVVAPPTKREREALWMGEALDAFDLSAMSLADLRVMANRMFRLLDADRPPLQAGERYQAAVAEIRSRARRVAARGGAPSREVFNDSPCTSRFELFIDGSLAAYLRYSMLGGQLTLRALVEKPGFEDRGLGRVLLRRAMLNAHKRRLAVVAGCASARAFLEQNPQYLTLARAEC